MVIYKIWSVSQNFLSFWTFLAFYDPKNPKNQNFEKMENKNVI